MARALLARTALAMVLSVACSASAEVIIIPVLDGNQNPIDYTLAEVMAMPGGLRVADKVFSDWSFTDASDYGGLAPSPAGIRVEGVCFDANANGEVDPLVDEIGLRFTGGWLAAGGQIVDTVITYKLTVDDPYFIVDNTLWMSDGRAGNGGVASIVEAVYDVPGPAEPVVVKMVWETEEQGVEDNFLEHIVLPAPYKQLWIRKDVGVNGGVQQTGIGHISQFYQTFSQVPEPSTLLLVCAGAALLVRRRR
jgi:hypothetical protein